MSDVDAIEGRKLARWRASRDGALYACPHCWQGAKVSGRCTACRRFDVMALGQQDAGRGTPPGPSVPARAQQLEDALRRADAPRNRRRGKAF